MWDYIEVIIEDYQKIIQYSVAIKIITIVLLIFAYNGIPIFSFSFIKFLLFVSFLLLWFLSYNRKAPVSLLLFAFFAAFYNPILPIYLHSFEAWQHIDLWIGGMTFFSIIFSDLLWYKNEDMIAHHIHRVSQRIRHNGLNEVLDYAKKYYKKGLIEKNDQKSRLNFEIALSLIDILNKNVPDKPEYYIMKGLCKSKIYASGVFNEEYKKALDLNKIIEKTTPIDLAEMGYNDFEEKLFKI